MQYTGATAGIPELLSSSNAAVCLADDISLHGVRSRSSKSQGGLKRRRLETRIQLTCLCCLTEVDTDCDSNWYSAAEVICNERYQLEGWRWEL